MLKAPRFPQTGFSDRLLVSTINKKFTALLNPGMNLSVSAVLRAALTLKFIPQTSNVVLIDATAVIKLVKYRGAGGSAPCVGVAPPHPSPHLSGNRLLILH